MNLSASLLRSAVDSIRCFSPRAFCVIWLRRRGGKFVNKWRNDVRDTPIQDWGSPISAPVFPRFVHKVA